MSEPPFSHNSPTQPTCSRLRNKHTSWLRSESKDGDTEKGAGATEVADSPPSPPTELGLEQVPPEVSRRPPADDIGAPANDIVQLVKPRKDWWDEGVLKSPIRGVAETSPETDPLDKIILSLPIPSYGLLGICSFFAIAFVGCIFQLFYDSPPAPVLGVPLTALIFALSGPTWVFLFIAAIKKGQKEADDEDDFPY